ncbi:DUF1611 domain-containing protein, partial [Burkholderia sp. SIMBA_057]
HEAGLAHHKGWAHAPLRPLPELVTLYEQLGSFLRPAKVVGVSVHTGALPAEQAARAIEEIEWETGLPAVDVIRSGADRLVDALSVHDRTLQR